LKIVMCLVHDVND